MSRPAAVYAMAEVLFEQVVEISDNIACRQALGFAGFTDPQITEGLHEVQSLARKFRGQEADRLWFQQLQYRWPLHG